MKNKNQLPRQSFTARQRRLAIKHGTPAEFAVAVYTAVPGEISMDEAFVAVQKYNREWNKDMDK